MGQVHPYVGQRASLTSSFGNMHVVTEIAQDGPGAPSWLSTDQCRRYVEQVRDDAGPGAFYVYTR
jgi:hypothetical protein